MNQRRLQRRRVPLGGRYIADFLAPSARLVVEVDGKCHANRQSADGRRDRRLDRLGYRVLRLPAVLIMRELEVALARVVNALRFGRAGARR
jgi:very-short-patch-repair endonuclease